MMQSKPEYSSPFWGQNEYPAIDIYIETEYDFCLK